MSARPHLAVVVILAAIVAAVVLADTGARHRADTPDPVRLPEKPDVVLVTVTAAPTVTPTVTETATPTVTATRTVTRAARSSVRTSPPAAAEGKPSGRGTVWDRLAECESGGDWAANTGNGFSGGLQWMPSTWRMAGGTDYAPTAHEATREQEIAVAEKWLARTSWEQWPTCSKRLGLR